MSNLIKLYAPVINSTLPAAASYRYQDKDYFKLQFYYQLNRAVSDNDYNKIAYEIREVTTNKLISSGQVEKKSNNSFGLLLSADKYPNGSFYKLQIAFVHTSGNVGYFSEVGIFKCVTDMQFQLGDFSRDEITINVSNTDTQEKLSTYKLQLYNAVKSEDKWVTSTLEYETDNIVYNNNIDENIVWDIEKLILKQNYILKIQYTTINNIQNSQKLEMIFSDDKAIVYGRVEKYKYCSDKDNGWIEFKDIELYPDPYLIYKSTDNGRNYYKTNQTISSESLREGKLGYFRDYNIDFNKSYKYILYISWANKVLFFKHEVGEGEEKEWEEIDPILADFEHMYLYDKDKQLKLSYNSKISSIKPTVLEQKTNTIGGKYPFFFRNGNVNYYEFPISALLSYLTDSDYSFINIKNFNDREYDNNYTNLSFDNFSLEQEYKKNVLEWLMNGQPKVFKSPVEGNHIVRIMNASLAPNDTLSRMLHTMSATAVEIADYNQENLNKYDLTKIITTPLTEPTRLKRQRTIIPGIIQEEEGDTE